MSQLSLTEQMGAMSLIDELRHQELLIQDHLNLPARRRAVEDRIRDYYRAQNIPVSDELISEGVRQYFAGRLAMEPATLSRFKTRFAMWHATRSAWGPQVARGFVKSFVIGTVSMLCASFGVHWYDAHQETRMKEALSLIGAQGMKQIELVTQATELDRSLSVARARASEASIDSAARVANYGLAAMISAHRALNADPEPAPNYANAEEAEAAVKRISSWLSSVRRPLWEAQQHLSNSQRILNLSTQHRALIASPAYLSAAQSYPALLTANDRADEAIRAADQLPANTAEKAVADLSSLIDSVGKIGRLQSRKQQLVASFAAMQLPTNDQATVDAMGATIDQHLKALDAAGAAGAIDALAAMLTFASTPIELTIVDRQGQRSGVERTYGGSGGKSWYAVVEAHDAAGQPVKLFVKSVETGKSAWTSTFAVRVTRSVYEQIKQDKLLDGHVDDKVMGSKPANTLTFKYDSKTSDNPDMIMEF